MIKFNTTHYILYVNLDGRLELLFNGPYVKIEGMGWECRIVKNREKNWNDYWKNKNGIFKMFFKL